MIRTLLFLFAASACLAQDTREILRKLAEITGLSLKTPVKQHTMRRDELKGYFEARIKESVKPEEIRLEELVLKRFGLAPKDFDLKKTTIDLMSEQAAAFYDYRKKKMVLLEGDSGLSQDMALVHELAHALADQHFRLDRFLKAASEDDDRSLARMAVMEGQATWLMSEFMAAGMGQSLTRNNTAVEMMQRMAGSAGSGFPIFNSVPLYMKESLVFPYAQGMMFQHKVVEKMGKVAFSEVFRRPPESTQEILHPERYFAREAAVKPPLPELPAPKQWKPVTGGTAGEFDHRVLLKQYSPNFELLASEWRGAQFRIFEHRSTKRIVLSYASQWGSEKVAGDFFRAYQDILKGKWKQVRGTKSTDDRFTGESEDGFFVVRLTGSTVSSLEGLESLP